MPIRAVPDGRYLPPCDGHRVWWCETGSPEGLPVLVLHGGPGGRTRLPPFQWFDGAPVRCIAFDQRGCGNSTPAGGLEHNTVQHLIDDIERLRQVLEVDAWALAAGSWGALLAVLYAAAHPQRVNGLFLRSAFLGSDAEVDRFFAPWPAWLGNTGAAWIGAAATGSPVELMQMAGGLCAGDPERFRARVAHAWNAFEAAQSRPGGLAAKPDETFVVPVHAPTDVATAAPLPTGLAVQAHYLWHRCFVTPHAVDDAVAALAGTLAARPVSLVHGLADAVCAPQTTATLAARWPGSNVRWVDGAGHDMSAPPMQRALTEAAQEWAARLASRPRAGDGQPGLFQRSLR